MNIRPNAAMEAAGETTIYSRHSQLWH